MQGYSRKSISPIRGAWTSLAGKRTNPARLSDCLNVQYSETGPSTRDGFSTQFLAVTGIVRAMYSWITSVEGLGKISRLLYYETDTLQMRDLIGTTNASLFTLAGSSVSIAEAGSKLFVAVVASGGRGAGEARIIYPVAFGTPTDKAFSGPPTVAPVMSDTGAGQCTVGTKKFAYIKESRSGFRGKPGPQVTYTVAAGGRALRMSVTGDTASDAAWYHPIMTTTANQDRWFFVPDAQTGVPNGVVGWPAIMDINISDDTLTRVGIEATDYFDKLSQGSSGTGPFSPSFVLPIWRRLAYYVSPKIYVSDIDDYESISEDQHVVYLPGKREAATGFMQRGIWYVLGPAWTYAYLDNSDVPATWQPPAVVSEALGTPSMFGVCARTGGDWAWVANPKGLYLFAGQYSELPISHLNQDWWDRINWTDPIKIEVKDNVTDHVVYVKAPLDGATEPNYLLTWDYGRAEGPPTPFEVDFSPYRFGFTSIYAIEPFIDPTTAKLSLLLAKSGKIIRQAVGGPSDDGLGIESYSRSGLVLTTEDSQALPCRLGAVDFGVSGVGLCEIEVRNKGALVVKQPAPIMLEPSPANEVHRKVSLTGNNFDVKVRTNGVGARFDLSLIRPYWTKWISNA